MIHSFIGRTFIEIYHVSGTVPAQWFAKANHLDQVSARAELTGQRKIIMQTN